MEKLKAWHVFDPTDFDGVVIDATKWEDSVYSVAFNFYCTKDSEESPQTGFTLCTMIFGESLKECHEKIMEVLLTNMFDEIEIASHGTLWSTDGDELETICWNDFDDDEDQPEHADLGKVDPPPTIH